MSAYRDGEADQGDDSSKRKLYEPMPYSAPTHDKIVERRLSTIAIFTGIIAVAVLASFIASLVIGIAAASVNPY